MCSQLVVPGIMDVDSFAVFQQRFGELCIELLADASASCGWTTLWCFAFAVQAGQGGMVPEDLFTVKVLERLCPSTDGVESEHAAAVRRLWFEAQVVTMSDLRRQTSRVEETAPKRISLPEREDRKARLQKKYNHLRLKGHLDPADSIINKFLNMLEINAPRWVPWEQCPSFSQEQQSDVKVSRTKRLPDARCAVVERSLRPEPLADVSKAYHIHLALTRRDIAAELAGVLSFKVHEDLRNTLMNALIDVPPDSRYQRLSLEHVREVDSFVWSQLVKEASHGTRAAGGLGVPPLDALMTEVEVLRVTKARVALRQRGRKALAAQARVGSASVSGSAR